MDPNVSTLERAFALAASGRFHKVSDIRLQLHREGYNMSWSRDLFWRNSSPKPWSRRIDARLTVRTGRRRRRRSRTKACAREEVARTRAEDVSGPNAVCQDGRRPMAPFGCLLYS